MNAKNIQVGGEVDSWCTKCKLVLAHTVVAMVEDSIEKVECKTCHGKHKFRAAAPKARKPKDPNAPARKVGVKKRKKDPTVIWEEALAGKDLSQLRTYAMSAEFADNQLLEHPTFGIGLITQVRAEGKMEVLFKDGSKLLVCNR